MRSAETSPVCHFTTPRLSALSQTYHWIDESRHNLHDFICQTVVSFRRSLPETPVTQGPSWF